MYLFFTSEYLEVTCSFTEKARRLLNGDMISSNYVWFCFLMCTLTHLRRLLRHLLSVTLMDSLLFQVQHYIFVVQAQDSGRPSLSSTLTVYFNVVDLNDNAPLFDPMSYSNEVFENVTVGTSVVTVSATDLDSGWSFWPEVWAREVLS